jgi:hypothetical protein
VRAQSHSFYFRRVNIIMPRFGHVAGLLLFLTVATYFISSGTPSPTTTQTLAKSSTSWPVL